MASRTPTTTSKATFKGGETPPTIVICGGIHDFSLTEEFVNSFVQNIKLDFYHQVCVIPQPDIAPYDVKQIDRYLKEQHKGATTPDRLILIGFSAGVVGLLGLARKWQRQGGTIASFFAFDGWGVPLWENFPCYRLSHDLFTHQTSHWLGGNPECFYAEPDVSHLDFWGSNMSIEGYFCQRDQNDQQKQKMTIVQFLNQQLNKTQTV